MTNFAVFPGALYSGDGGPILVKIRTEDLPTYCISSFNLLFFEVARRRDGESLFGAWLSDEN